MRISPLFCTALTGLLLTAGCQKKQAAPAGQPAMQAMPVQTMTATLSPVPQTSEYVATIKSRRSAAITPRVGGVLTQILVKSGDRVKSGQILMEIDPRQQLATVDSLKATERQKKATYDYNVIQFERQKKLYEAGVVAKMIYDQAVQALDNAKADYESSVQSRKTQEELLSFYTLRAPFEGIIGDIPVHVGDYVSQQNTGASALTTLDEGKDLEAYIYVPAERYGQLKAGLPVDLTDTNGQLLEKSQLSFVSPQVDSTLQGILAKASVRDPKLRTAQMIKARIVWTTTQMAVVPVLAVKRQGNQSFVFVLKQQGPMTLAHQTSVALGEAVGNTYSIVSGIAPGDKIVVSSTQFLVNDMPVKPLN